MRKPKLTTRMKTTRNMFDFTNNNTMDEYKDLFDNIEITRDMTIEFRKIADALLNDFAIKANNKVYRLAEIEFYMHVENIHPDTFIHAKAKNDINEARENQHKMGLWYFHYSGIDLTFGDEKKRYGGILIRKVIDIENGESINGPLKLKNRFLNNYSTLVNKEPFLQLIKFKHEVRYPYSQTTFRKNLGIEDNEEYRERYYNFYL